MGCTLATHQQRATNIENPAAASAGKQAVLFCKKEPKTLIN
jgi:hypothetical protein